MKLLGNSVAVNAVKHVGKEIIEYMYDKEEYRLKKIFNLKNKTI